jgi:hypothetical protein
MFTINLFHPNRSHQFVDPEVFGPIQFFLVIPHIQHQAQNFHGNFQMAVNSGGLTLEIAI